RTPAARIDWKAGRIAYSPMKRCENIEGGPGMRAAPRLAAMLGPDARAPGRRSDGWRGVEVTPPVVARAPGACEGRGRGRRGPRGGWAGGRGAGGKEGGGTGGVRGWWAQMRRGETQR